MKEPYCYSCPLFSCEGPIKGEGDPSRRVWIVGEAPGREEIVAGSPFVGKAGALLRSVLKAIGVREGEVYLDNAVLCRPPSNRTPTPAEVRQCSKFLYQKIEGYQPERIVTVGATALSLFTKESLSAVVGKRLEVKIGGCSVAVFPAYHPAFFLRVGGSNMKALLERPIRGAFGMESSEADESQELEESCYKVISDPSEFPDWSETWVALDCETTSLSKDAQLLGIGLSAEQGSGIYVPLRVPYAAGVKEVWSDEGAVREALSRLIKRNWICTHNGGFDLYCLKGWGLDFTPQWVFDTMLALYLLDENGPPGSRSLEYLALAYPDLRGYKEETSGAQDSFLQLTPSEIARRCVRDADLTRRESLRLVDKIKEEGLLSLMQDFLLPVWSMLVDAELRGILVSLERLSQLKQELSARLQSAEEELKRAYPINWSSTTQVRELFFGRMKIGEPLMFSKGGHPSVAEEHLKQFSDHPVVRLYLDRTEVASTLRLLENSYSREIGKDGRVRTTFHLTGTVTGRLSSSRPNLQNPRHDVEFRSMFIATPGYALVYCDNSQSEIRWLAELSEDKTLISACKSGKDVHLWTSSVFYRVPYEELEARLKAGDKEVAEKRRFMKHVSFGVVYGISDSVLASLIYGVPNPSPEQVEEVVKLKEAWFQICPSVRQYQEEVFEAIHRHKEVTSVFGRKRRLKDEYQEDPNRALRQGFNFLIQSVSSDFTLYRMLSVYRECKRLGLDVYPLLTIHDSMMFEVRDNPHTLSRFLMVLEEHQDMKVYPQQEVPIWMDIEVSYRWGVLEPLHHPDSGQLPAVYESISVRGLKNERV